MSRKQSARNLAGWLASLAIGGQIVATALTILLASRLPLDEFEAYAVAASVFLLAVAIAPLGADRAALRVLPPLLATGDRTAIAAFLGFARRRLAVGAVVVTVLGLIWCLLAREAGTPMRAALAAGFLSLPGGVAAHFGLEALTAAGSGRLATAIARIGVPACVFAVVAFHLAAGAPLAGAAAIGAWGIGWIGAGLLMAARLRRVVGSVLPAARSTEPDSWRRISRSLWLYRAAVALQAQSGILAVELLDGTAVAVGGYAAATAIVAPALVLATSTNRVYAREIAVLLDRRDGDGLRELESRRRRWLLIPLAAFLCVAMAFPGRILALFRPEFVAAGTWPIRILAASAVVSIALSLAPIILKYQDLNRVVFRILAASTALQMLLLLGLVPAFGATGAALSHGFSVIVMYASFAFQSRRSMAGQATR